MSLVRSDSTGRGTIATFIAGGEGRRKAQLDAIKAHDNRKDGDRQKELATLYSIVRVTEALEAAHSADAVEDNDYASECYKLIRQFKETEKALVRQGLIDSGEAFMQDLQKENNIDCYRAMERLVHVGHPSTAVNAGPSDTGTLSQSSAITQEFITLADVIQLGTRGVDEIKSYVLSLTHALNTCTFLPADFKPTLKMRAYLEKLHLMRAVEKLTEDDARQLKMELDEYMQLYQQFISKL